MSEKGFYLYASWWKIISEFSDTDFCEFMRAVANYAIEKKQPTFKNKSLEFAFRFVKNEIDMQEDKAAQYSKTQSNNGKRGGAPIGNSNARKQAKQAETSETSETSLNIDKDKDKDKDKDEEDKEEFFSSSSFFIDEFFEIENEILGRRDEIQLSDRQIELLAEKYGEKGAAVFRDFWAAVKESKWLQSQEISLMLNNKVFENVLNGTYRTYQQRQNQAKPRDLIGTNFIDRD